jgi:hypothetical protein
MTMKRPAKLDVGLVEHIDSDSGVDIHYLRSGHVVSVFCGTGKFKAAHDANTTIATLPDGFRPTSLMSTPDYGTNGVRVRIFSNGDIRPWVAKAKNDNVIFLATFLAE